MAKKFAIFTYLLNTVVEAILGLIMLLVVSFFSKLVYVVEPSIFIRMIGAFGLCLAILSSFGLLKIWKNKDGLKLATDITIFFFLLHIVLSIILGVAASMGLLTWLGLIVHLPLALLFAAVLVLQTKSS